MDYGQPRSPAAFAFPPRSDSSSSLAGPSSSGPAQLAAPFQLPPRGESLPRHQPNLSSASTASSSASSSSPWQLLDTPSSRGGKGGHSHSASVDTQLTSDSYGSQDDCYGDYDDEDDGASVLEQLYGFTTKSRADDLEEPPRGGHDSRTHSGLLLRERTRYRSSASYAPSNPTRDPSAAQFATLLSSLQLDDALERCFCGKPAEEESIYCSRLCAQTDALTALCGGSSGAEDSSDGVSLRSGSSGGGAVSGAESHYRRVEREEARRERERTARQHKERQAARRRGDFGSGSSAGSGKKVAGSLWRNEADVSSARGSGSSTGRVQPPPRTSSRRTPSLTSSLSSLSTGPSSAIPSPLSPAFPRTAHPPSPFIVEPPSPTTDSSSSYPTPPSPPLRPCTPNTQLHPTHHEVGDIYASYLAATPLASEKLRTPTQFGSSSSFSPSTLTPRARAGLALSVADDSPTRRGSSAASVGLRMLELCADDEDGEELEEVADRVGGTEEAGWGVMKERMARRGPGAYGHQKGKLSFEDVVGILGA
ncbi:hypothetical protein JCM8097_001163 [Rhodosporidiobolus ruineniae]